MSYYDFKQYKANKHYTTIFEYKGIKIQCTRYDTRQGFGHDAYCVFNGKEYFINTKYQNRTWESFDFQSVLYLLFSKINDDFFSLKDLDEPLKQVNYFIQ